ncbi:MAG: hypothetical protein AB8U97_01555, partial [Rickettsia endosymbiont of Haemaphysalis japonica]
IIVRILSYSIVIARSCMASMSFPRKRESSKTYKNLFLYVYFTKYTIFVPIRLFLLDPRFRGNDIESLTH